MKNELVQKIETAIREGLEAKGTGPRCGCGRAYVILIGKVERNVLAAYRKAAENLGIRYLPEAYGAGKKALYIGYDNGTGVPLAKAEAIAEKLRAVGLPAYDEGVAD